MPSTLGPVDYANVALSKIGAAPINSLLGADRSSTTCNSNFLLAYLEVSRSGKWNCLLTTSQLTAVAQTPIAGNPAPSPFVGAWAVNTAYAANVYLSYGGYYYLVLQAYTSSTNFLNDLTLGYLSQTDQQTNQTFTDQQLDCGFGNLGSMFPSGWAFQYALPDDFQLLGILNDNICWDFDGSGGDDYEIMGSSIFCNESIAVIQYVKNQPDTTQWDSLFGDAFTLKLGAAIATPLRQDGGAKESELLAAYDRQLSKARTRNGGEARVRRFNPIASSRFLRARFTRIGPD